MRDKFIAKIKTYFKITCEIHLLNRLKENEIIEAAGEKIPKSFIKLVKKQKELEEIFSVPFYLNLVVLHADQLIIIQENEAINLSKLSEFLIELSIDRPIIDKVSSVDVGSVKTIRRKVLRELVYFNNRDVPLLPHYNINIAPQRNALKSLEENNVLAVDSNGLYKFNHLIYEEWVIKQITNEFTQQCIEAFEDPKYMLEILCRRLSKSLRIFGKYLYSSLELREYLKVYFSGVFDENCSNLVNLFFAAFFSKNEKYITNILDIIYSMLLDEPYDFLKIFSGFDLDNDEDRDFLRNKHYPIKMLDRLVNFEKTFEEAVDILCKLTNLEYDYEERHVNDHIQYRLDVLFYPLMGNISYEKRSNYLLSRILSKENFARPLLLSIYCSIQVICYKHTPAELNYYVDENNQDSIRYDYDEGSEIVLKYGYFAVELLIKAASSVTDLKEEAESLLISFIKENIGNHLSVAKSFTQASIERILKKTNIKKNMLYIEKIYDRMRSEGSSIVHDPDEFDCFSKRIELFYHTACYSALSEVSHNTNPSDRQLFSSLTLWKHIDIKREKFDSLTPSLCIPA